MLEVKEIDLGESVKIKKFTVKEVFEALKLNGFEHLRGQWLDVDDKGKPVGACVLGQAAINLGVAVSSDDLDHDLWGFYAKHQNELDEIGYSIQEAVNQDLAKYEKNTIELQLNKFLVDPKSRWSRLDYTTRGAGSTIIHWNDAIDPNDETKYTLRTYKEVVDMAYDVLSPHFSKTVRIAVKEYDLSNRAPDRSNLDVNNAPIEPLT